MFINNNEQHLLNTKFLIRSKQYFIHNKHTRKSVAIQKQTYSFNLKKVKLGEAICLFIHSSIV